MTLYALDPGTEQSALVRIDEDGQVHGRIWTNSGLLEELRNETRFGHLVIEQVESYGMPVGVEVFQTVFWSGRFAQVWECDGQFTWSQLGRKAVKLALCGSMKAKDPNIRQRLIDLYGGPSCVKKGGPLYGIKSHMWSSLALAVAWKQLENEAGR